MDKEVTVLFADISGSTKLYETLGDEAALVLISDCLQLLAQISQQYQGQPVKTIGDALMLYFPHPSWAVQAALVMQDRANQFFHKRRVISGLKIGFNHGPVLSQADGDLFGDTVNVAARLVELAKRNQILAPAATVAQIDPAVRLEKRLVDRTYLRGKSIPIEVYEILHPADATLVETTPAPTPPVPTVTHLRLQFQDQVYELGAQRPTLAFGRAPDNDLVIRCEQVSRQHGRIEWRRGKFVLCDQSANGTYVQVSGQAPIHVHREEYILTQEGTIHPGSPQVQGIHYQCLATPDSGGTSNWSGPQFLSAG